MTGKLRGVRLFGSGVGSNTKQRASGGHGPTSSTCAPTLAFSSPRHTSPPSLLPPLRPAFMASLNSLLNPESTYDPPLRQVSPTYAQASLRLTSSPSPAQVAGRPLSHQHNHNYFSYREDRGEQ